MATHSSLKSPKPLTSLHLIQIRAWNFGLTGTWTPLDVRDQIVDFVRRWSLKTAIGVGCFIPWPGISPGKFYCWRKRYGCVNEHNAWVPRDHWLEPWETAVEIVLEAAKENYPAAKPRIISDNGPQFIARDCKEFIRISGMRHVRTSPYYPQSNGKLERWQQSLKSECIGPGVPLTPEDARRLIESYVEHYNTVRLHSAIGYVTPLDMLTGRQAQIHAARDRKREHARRQRQLGRQQAA